MRIIITIILKELKLFLRDPAGLIMLFILPAIFVFVLSIALQGAFSSTGNKEKIALLIVNNDKGTAGNEIINGLKKIPFFQVIETINGNQLTLPRMKEELKNGKYQIALYIPENIQEALDFKAERFIDIYVDPVLSSEFAGNITGAVQNYVNLTIIRNISAISETIFTEINTKRISEIDRQIIEARQKKNELTRQLTDILTIEMDENTKAAIEKLTQVNITEMDTIITGLIEQKKSYLEAAAGNTAMIKHQYQSTDQQVGLKVQQIFYSTSGQTVMPNSVQQNVPGWTIFALFWIVQTIAMNIIMERQSGVFKRILIAPISRINYITGKIIPFFIINLIQALCMFLIGIFILPLFGCPQLVIHNIPAMILMTMCISLTAISLGLFISTIADSIFFAASVSALILIILTVIGGIMVPRFVMPQLMQTLSYFIPHGWALDGYLNILIKNYSIIQIIPNMIILLGFSVLFFILAFIRIWKTNLNHNE